MLKLSRCKERWLNIFEALASVVLFMMTNNCKLQGQENNAFWAFEKLDNIGFEIIF